MKTRELISRAAEKAGGLNKLSREVLGISSAAMAHFNTGKSPVPPYRAAQLAKYLGEDELAAAVCALEEKAKGPERSYWKELKKTIACVVVALCIAASIGSIPSKSYAYEAVSVEIEAKSLDIQY